MRNFINKHWNGIMDALIIICAIMLAMVVFFIVKNWEVFTPEHFFEDTQYIRIG